MSEKQLIKAWMPLNKDSKGGFIGILSDTSLDRDEEFMSKELLESWAKDSSVLPMLADHDNRMEKYIGGWKNKKLISKNGGTALTAKPFFLESNPLAQQIKGMVEEALDKGLGVGISIGAIPHETIEKEVNGVMRTGYSKAEIVEATVVPIQSNRNATFTALAKSYGLNKTGDIMSEELKYSQKAYDDAILKIKKESDEKVAEAEAKVEEAEAKVKEAEEAKTEAESKVEEAETGKSESEQAKEEAETVLEAEKKKVARLNKEVEELKKFSGVENMPNVDKPTGDYSKKGLNKDGGEGLITFEKLLARKYAKKEGDE